MNPNTNTSDQPQNPQNQNGTPSPDGNVVAGQPTSVPYQGNYQNTPPDTANMQPSSYGNAAQSNPYQSAPFAQFSQSPTQPNPAYPSATPIETPPGKKPFKRNKLVLGVAGLLLLVVVAGIIFIVIKGRSVPTVDEATFQKNLVSCTRSITYAPKEEGFGSDTSFKINKREGSGCSVEVHIGKSTNPNDVLKPIQNTSMKCVIGKDESSAEELFTNPDKYNCEGTMVAALKDFQNSFNQ